MCNFALNLTSIDDNSIKLLHNTYLVNVWAQGLKESLETETVQNTLKIKF